MTARIPVAAPLVSEEDARAVAACLAEGRLTAGASVERFESAWAAYCGRKHGIAMANGTGALEAALAVLDLGPGDEVILPAFTLISCALAILRCGATPVVVDSDPVLWTMDPAHVASRVTRRTRAILAVHVYGHPAAMEPILAIAGRHGLAVVEDAAEAHGSEAEVEGRFARCGSFGLASAFSFYANKLITTGEGGMVLTDDARLAGRLRSYRNLAHSEVRRFRHETLGANLRLTELQGALGLSQLSTIEDRVAWKRRLAARYRQLLAGVPLVHQGEAAWARPVPWMHGVVLPEDLDLDAEELGRRLDVRGVETRPFFLGLHEQPALRRLGLLEGEPLPVAERLARRGLYLPSGFTLTEAQLEMVARAARESLAPPGGQRT